MKTHRLFALAALLIMLASTGCFIKVWASEIEEAEAEAMEQAPSSTQAAPAAAEKASKTQPQQTSTPSPEAPEQTENVQQAENIDLSEPVMPKAVQDAEAQAEPEPQAQDKTEPKTPASSAKPVSPKKKDSAKPQKAKPKNSEPKTKAPDATVPPKKLDDQAFVLLQKQIVPGTTTRLSWSPHQSFEGIATPTPVLVAHGVKPGPKLCLTAAVHGDELNGIEIVRRIMYEIDPSELSGTVIGVPIVNLQGFRRGSRYLTDRRDLNRYFPGNPQGSSAARIAHSFFENVIKHCDLLVDLHTGSFFRTNLPQLRANLKNEAVKKMTASFDAIAVLHSEGAHGTLRRAAVDAGIPAVTLEAGGPMELEHRYVEQGTSAVKTLLDKSGMLNTLKFWGTPQPAYYGSLWVRVDQGGILFSDVKLGARVRKGDLLGTVTDPITNIKQLILSPAKGRVIGMAINQVVLPGFAAFHIGVQSGKRKNSVENAIIELSENSQENDEEEESSFDEFD